MATNGVKKAGGTEKVSHGRGGAANINPDDQAYTDASIVREGPVGDQGSGAFSGGRGGHGNIGSPHLKPTSWAGDADVVPETAIRPEYDNFHTGRGGEGNIHQTSPTPSTNPSKTKLPTDPARKPSATNTDPTPAAEPSAAPGPAPTSNTNCDTTATNPPSTQPTTLQNELDIRSTQAAPQTPESTSPPAEAPQSEDHPKAKRKAEKAQKRAEWRARNPPPEHDGLGDRGLWWVKRKIFG